MTVQNNHSGDNDNDVLPSLNILEVQGVPSRCNTIFLLQVEIETKLKEEERVSIDFTYVIEGASY